MRRSLTAALCALLVLTLFAPLAASFPLPASAATLAPPPMKVAVVYSQMTENASKADGATYGWHRNRVNYVVDALKASGENMTVTIIGDSELASVKALREYDVVVLVRNVATQEPQRFALRDYVARGGGLVSMFSTSRYDYRPGQSSPYGGSGYSSYGTPYFQFNFAWGFAGSSFMSQAFEYGEVSELIATRFCNDPLFQAGYNLVSSGASHPILQMTAKDLGTSVGSIAFTDSRPQWNETVWPTSGAPITTLLNYSNERINGGGIENASTQFGTASHMAGWAMPYYYGKVVSYGFQLYDMVPGNASARRMMINSVKWAGTHDGYGPIKKAPDVTIDAWYTRGQIWAKAGVLGGGSNIQVRGKMQVEFFKPGESSPYQTTEVKGGWIPVSPGERYVDTVTSGIGASSGRWKVRAKYTYYDYFRGGWTSVYRDAYLSANGSGMSWSGVSDLVIPKTALAPPAGSTQVAGSDRAGTAVALSQTGWPTVDKESKSVILASAWNFPDALAASALAGKLHAPILLVNPTSLPPQISSELTRLYAGTPADVPAKVYVLGSPVVLADGTVDQAKALIADAGGGPRPVEAVRLAGPSRYDTAARIAEAVGKSQAQGFEDTAFIATGTNYADALSIGPIAAKLRIPILFAGSTVPPATQDALRTLGIKHAIIVGSTAAVSQGAEDWLEANGFRAGTDARLQGPTRYDTCLAVLDFAVKNAGMSDAALYVSTGTNYPDALALAPLAADKAQPVLLVNPDDMAYSPGAAAYFVGRRSSPPVISFVGSPNAISDYVRGQIGAALGQ